MGVLDGERLLDLLVRRAAEGLLIDTVFSRCITSVG
jgi:hypothetical protein